MWIFYIQRNRSFGNLTFATKEELRYSNYSHMKFELEYPEKVKPFFNENTPFFEKNSERNCRIAFFILLLINIVLLPD